MIHVSIVLLFIFQCTAHEFQWLQAVFFDENIFYAVTPSCAFSSSFFPMCQQSTYVYYVNVSSSRATPVLGTEGYRELKSIAEGVDHKIFLLSSSCLAQTKPPFHWITPIWGNCHSPTQGNFTAFTVTPDPYSPSQYILFLLHNNSKFEIIYKNEVLFSRHNFSIAHISSSSLALSEVNDTSMFIIF